jgi:ribonuclease HII
MDAIMNRKNTDDVHSSMKPQFNTGQEPVIPFTSLCLPPEIAQTNQVTLKKERNKTNPLNAYFREDMKWEIGVDEAGRGPMFGRLYVAATSLPKTNFKHEWMKDSKRFSSQKKIREAAEYIKSNAVAWTVRHAEPWLIDEINIRQAVLRTMCECCRDLIEKIQMQDNFVQKELYSKLCILIDGNDFPPFTIYNPETETLEEIESHTIEGGDNLYTCIAAASILAKVTRDDYIAKLCEEHPRLKDLYGIDKNKGYGTAIHMRGIKEHGITKWHRKSYGLCKTAHQIDI